MDIVNNKIFKIIKIENDDNTIQNENKFIKFDVVKDNAFQRCFRICYCTSIHSSQGLSIGENDLIHQFNNQFLTRG